MRLASPPPAAPPGVAAGRPRVPGEELFFFLRTLPLASGGIFWEGSGGIDIVTPGIVPITLWYEGGRSGRWGGSREKHVRYRKRRG